MTLNKQNGRRTVNPWNKTSRLYIFRRDAKHRA